ncbi:inactive CLIP domain-containing serine protease A8-like isoform X2 [Metopolophium dirhodum]|uniref:inactive CLIP domain-containing serine protease A8-like isoform X2 n=1 Tax=Metopolophium dirhodum TaxID=44670 RepID=UPI00298FF49A|nr:inactive CLIP domain-containing serine protease A8-like isoform X2 [Metopolophium dirhodum]
MISERTTRFTSSVYKYPYNNSTICTIGINRLDKLCKNYTMHVFGLILFAGMASSSAIAEMSIPQLTVDSYPAYDEQSSTGLKPTTILETSTLSDENDDQDCICTPYHLCKSHKPDYEGHALINIRINAAPCQSYLDVCCNDDKITSIEKSSPEDYSKEPSIDQMAVTNNPSDGQTDDSSKIPSGGQKEEFTKESFVHQKGNFTTEPNVSISEDNSNNPSDSQTDDSTKNPSESQTDNSTKDPSDDQKEENTKEPFVDQKGDFTQEPNVNHNEAENTKNPSDSQTDNSTNDPSDGPKEEYTKEPCICPIEDFNKKPFDSQSENLTKDPSVDHSYAMTDKSILKHNIITTEPGQTSNNHEDQHQCGTWNKNGIGFRIGDAIDNESEFGEFPSMVAIFKENVSKEGEKKLVLHCGGSLIEKDVILTATHCVIKEDISTLIVRAGEWDLKTEKEIYPHQDRRVSKIVTHPDYSKKGIYNDVALIFTDNSFSLQENIQPICLPSTNDIFINDKCYSGGWGKTVSYNNYTIIKKTESGKTKETGQYEVSILKKVELPIVPRNKCMDALRATRLGPKFVLHDSFICAGGQEGKDTCKGDGGSPLMCPYKDYPDRLVQVGIVAWGISCGLADIPAAYVNVAGYVYWIKNEIEKGH